jgi:hypothetical protein
VKPHFLHGHQLVITNGRHNLFHWLTVVIIRAFRLVIFGTLGIYLFSVGYLISYQSIFSLLPPSLLEKLNYYLLSLPYSLRIKEAVFSLIGNSYQKGMTWWTMVIGLPLVISGTIIIITVLFDLYYALLVPHFNHTHCPFCQESLKIK